MERKQPSVYETGSNTAGLPEFIKHLMKSYPHTLFRPPIDRFASLVHVTWIEDNRIVGFDLNIHQESAGMQADVEAYLGKV